MRTSVAELRAGVPHVSIGAHAADLLRLGEQLDLAGSAGASLVHLDVMDGVFCPQMTFGPPLVAAVPDRFVKDVHLMIEEPLGKLDAFLDAGASMLTFHLESTRHPHRVLGALAGTGVLRGVALNPGTPLQSLEPLLGELELVLLLAIDPGWPGQGFPPWLPRRVESARELIGSAGALLGVDGAITRTNIGSVAALGVDLIVCGSAAFGDGDPRAGTQALIEAARAARAELSGEGDRR
jgi:ribulose-phosphate 3-epimerase